MNIVEPYVQTAIYDQLALGRSIRQIAADLEIAKGTVQRYRDFFVRANTAKGVTVYCACGKEASHNGWCSERFRLSPARQAFMARWRVGRPPAIIRIKSPPRLNLHYPFIPPQGLAGEDGIDLLLLVNGHVPQGLPDQLRCDVCQEIIAAVLAGELDRAEIPRQLKAFIRRVRKETTDYMAFSIDSPRRDGRSWHDVLPAEQVP